MDEALNWLEGNYDGYPRTWAQEHKNTKRRGCELYDDFSAPPIAGYERLEKLGKAVRGGVVIDSSGQERVHFVLASAV
jgi:hypothetical protein